MNLTRLRVFDAVVRRGTFAAAAEQLTFTPSAVSQHIARLEAEVGTVLLERTARGVRLTAAGRVLHARAQRILREVDEAEADLQALARMRSGDLIMGAFPTATQTLCARALKVFRARHMGIDVRLVDDEPHNLLVRLRDRQLEIAVVFGFEGRPIGLDYAGRTLCRDDAFEYAPLFDDPFVAVLPHGHRLAGRETLGLGDLRDEIVVGSRYTPGHDRLLALAAELGFEPILTGHAVADYQSVRALVEAGDGIAVIPELATRLPHPGTVTRPFHDAVPFRRVSVAHRPDAILSPAARAMLELLRDVSARRADPRDVPDAA